MYMTQEAVVESVQYFNASWLFIGEILAGGGPNIRQRPINS